MALALQWHLNGQLQTYTIDATQPVTIGRLPTNALVIGDPTISRSHAELTEHAGELFIRNVSARNHLLIDNVAIPSGQSGIIEAGSILQLGKIQFQVLAIELPKRPTVSGERKIKCTFCGRAVELSRLDCPWCGTHLPGGQTVEF